MCDTSEIVPRIGWPVKPQSLKFAQTCDSLRSGMANNLATLGAELETARKRHGWSALALSKAAGLSMNYVRNIERGLRRPKPPALASLCDALELSDHERAQLRRLAGIDPDPAGSEEARAARRGAWRPLTYILANHVHLPRLELPRMLESRRPLGERDRDLLRQAAESADIVSFSSDTPESPSPGRGLTRLLEETFAAATVDDVQHIERVVVNATYMRKLGDAYRWHERWFVVWMLRAWNRPAVSEWELFQRVHKTSYDYAFAACFFPAIYWHACSVWPFDKIIMPHAKCGERTQRRLYSEVRAGITIETLDAALIGLGELGSDVVDSPAARPSPWSIGDPYLPEWVETTLRTTNATHRLTGPPMLVDAVFDHLDRCEFLERFPFIKVDRLGFAELARSLKLPSWPAWVTQVSGLTKIGDDQPPRSPERFAGVLFDGRTRTMSDDDPDTLDSYTARRVTAETALAVARKLGTGDWKCVANAARALELGGNWLAVVEALANQHRTAPSTER